MCSAQLIGNVVFFSIVSPINLPVLLLLFSSFLVPESFYDYHLFSLLLTPAGSVLQLALNERKGIQVPSLPCSQTRWHWWMVLHLAKPMWPQNPSCYQRHCHLIRI